MGEPDLRRGDLLADEAKKWWVPYAAEFVGTLLFQVFGGSTAVTMDAVFNLIWGRRRIRMVFDQISSNLVKLG